MFGLPIFSFDLKNYCVPLAAFLVLAVNLFLRKHNSEK